MQEQLFGDYGKPRKGRYQKRVRNETDRKRDRKRGNHRHHCVCIICGCGFLGAYRAKYCSPEHRAQRRHGQTMRGPYCKLKWFSCRQCERTYLRTPSWDSWAYCSMSCARERKREQDRRYNAEKRPGRATGFTAGYCQECHEPFVVRGRPGDAFCTRGCWRRNSRRRGKQMRDKRIKNVSRKDAIALPKLAERDGWRCHLCHRPVSKRTWSIDHLIPLSDGGTHTWDNVALAHFRCNSLRGTKGTVQLRVL